MLDRVALWNSKWQYEQNPPRPVKPRELDEFNLANETPVDIVAATSTMESASSHNVDDHNGSDDVNTDNFLYFIGKIQQQASV